MSDVIVVGANYGDEGKGLMTDYLCAKHNAERVIRFNGGAQAGHTVILDDKRHVHSHFGAGTLRNIQTEFASSAILHPGVALKEADRLNALGIHPPKILVSRNSPITTPIDQAINQMLEKKRGSNRHGSCGLGINETVERHNFMKNVDVSGLDDLEYFNLILSEWLPIRMEKLDFSADEIGSTAKMMKENLTDSWIKNVQFAFSEDGVYEWIGMYDRSYESAIYEGAQGLQLDEELGDFPFVTRSTTGIRNALHHLLLTGRQQKTVEIVYCTRTYFTRHGAGPLPFENFAEQIIGRVPADPTNAPNDWQGTIRYAPLNLFELVRRIEIDLIRNSELMAQMPGTRFNPVIALTCMDQSDEVMVIKSHEGRPEKMKTEDIPQFIKDTYRIQVKYQSYGPSAKDVKEN